MANLEGSLPLRCEGGPVFFLLPPSAGPLVGGKEVGGLQGCVRRGLWKREERGVNHVCNRTGFPLEVGDSGRKCPDLWRSIARPL